MSDVSTETQKNKKKEPSRPPFRLDTPLPDKLTDFCAGVIHRSKDGLLEFACVPYRCDGTGKEVIKLAGGMGKKGESPARTVSREIHEELGVKIEEGDFHFVFASPVLRSQERPDHIKLFFVVATEIKQPLRTTPYDAETGIPQWVPPEWLKLNLFGVHKEAFPKAIDFLLQYFLKHKNLEGLLAAVSSGLLEPDNKIKGLLLQRALKDPNFALSNACLLEEIGVGQ